MPPSPRPRKLPRLRPAAAVEAVAPARVSPGGFRLSWAVGAALLVLSGIVWFVQSHDDSGAAAAHTSGAALTAESPVTASDADDAVEAPLPAVETKQVAAAPPREPIDVHKLPSSIAVPRTVPKAAPAPSPEPVAPPPAAPLPPPEPAPVVVAQAPAPKPVPDRWQRLAERLAACPPGLFERVYCQESLRLEHCDGYWGRVAPCPARVERDHGN